MAKPESTEPRMTAAAFMAWYDLQPKGRRYELLNGRVYEMQSERLGHTRTKTKCQAVLAQSIAKRGLLCESIGDGMAVRVDEATVFEPDVSVRCGAALSSDITLILDPIIVVEVLSPTTQHVDIFRKFNGYFRNPSIAHYIIINSVDGNLVHHRRGSDGRIESSHWASGVLVLDPPGLSLDLAELFGEPA